MILTYNILLVLAGFIKSVNVDGGVYGKNSAKYAQEVIKRENFYILGVKENKSGTFDK